MKMTVWIWMAVILSSCAHVPSENKEKKSRVKLFTLLEPPTWGKTSAGDPLHAGGFSGLLFLGKTESGEYQFMTLTDRGPNGQPLPATKAGRKARPFLAPEFQPRLVKLETDSKNNSLKVIEEIPLTDPQGHALSGKPQWPSLSADENGVDLKGNPLAPDMWGIDPEGLTRDDQGFYWVCEEYRPSLLKFDSSGRLQKRFIPRNSLPKAELRKIQKAYGPQVLVEALPEEYKYRKTNRGFEGIAFAGGKIHALLQSPLKVPGSPHENTVRLLEFDPQTEKVTGEALYPFEKKGVDKIGDLTSSVDGSGLLAIEQNTKTGPESAHWVRKFKLPKGLKQSAADLKSRNDRPDQMELLEPETLISLNEVGYDFANKVEGLAVVPEELLAVINDNDFGVNNAKVPGDEKTPSPARSPGSSVLGLITW